MAADAIELKATAVVYSLEDDDRPLRTAAANRRASLDDRAVGGGSRRRPVAQRLDKRLSSSFNSSFTTTERSSSASSPTHFAIPNFLHKRITRSFDALDGTDAADQVNGFQQQQQEQAKPILKKSSSDTELIAAAPETEHTVESRTDHEDGIDNVREAIFQNDIETGRKSSVKFSDDTLDNSSRSTRLGSARVAFASQSPSSRSSVSNLARGMSQVLTRSKGRRSMTAQRYQRAKSFKNFMKADVRETLEEAREEMSDDTKHRIKNAICCGVFAVLVCALLYYMLREG